MQIKKTSKREGTLKTRVRGFNVDKLLKNTFESRHDKTDKLSVRPVKTQISLGIRPVWSQSLRCPHEERLGP